MGRVKLPLALVIATIATTTWVGGWAFSVTLMSILIAHEMGHYLVARRHGVEVSLPYFIPVPLEPLGTMGAVITMRTEQATRNQLLDIGAAGPIAGFLVAVPAMIIGIRMSSVVDLKDAGMLAFFGDSILSSALTHWLRPELGPGHDLEAHPIWIGAWGGFLVTAINLLPMGQLDGGHVLHAFTPRRSAVWGRRVFRALVVLGIVGAIVHAPTIVWMIAAGMDATPGDIIDVAWVKQTAPWLRWFTYAFFIWAMFGRFTGLDHPPLSDPDTPLTRGRRWVAGACLVIFMLTFMPNPLWVDGVWKAVLP